MAATGGVLAALLVTQFSLKRYVGPVYWACVVVISVFGTQITDKLTDTYNVPLTTTTPVFAAILALVFAACHAVERTLSIHSITTVRREAFYWLAILFTFALDIAAGGLVAEKFTLGYAVSIGLFAGVIAVVVIAHFRFGLNAVLSFWLAYIMTRPLGASIGDFMSQNDPQAGGMNLGTTATSYIFLAVIFAMVAYLQVTKRDRTPTEVVAAELAHERDHAPHGPRPQHHRPYPQGRSELAPQEG